MANNETQGEGQQNEGERQLQEATAKLLDRKPKIFVFCNGCALEWHNFVAIAEDGTILAGHVCSAHGYAAHDMGVLENGWKRDRYAQHYPDGFEVEYVEVTDTASAHSHPGLNAAFDNHAAKTVAANTKAGG